MKPILAYFDWFTTDLTKCEVHSRDDGAVVVHVPAEWELFNTVTMQTLADGTPTELKQYKITKWHEHVIVPPRETQG